MPDDIVRWLTEHAHPLSTLTPGAPTQDLKPLGEALRGTRIVGLGESTHGTAEFFRLKHRIIEFLVLEEGFTTLAMEASQSAGHALDAYVRHGIGDPERLVTRLGFWTWRTREMVDVVEWLRAYNRHLSEERRVRFVGTDPQRCADSADAVAAFLRRTVPVRAGDTYALEVLAQARPASQPDPERALMRHAEEIARLVADRRERSGPGDGADEALEHARILVRAADLVTRPFDPSAGEDSMFAARDRYMAEAVTRLVDDDPGARVMVWAHNGHIAKGTYGVRVPALGSRLRERYGDAYYALALFFGRGSFLARRGDDLQGPPVPHRIGTGIRSLEARLVDAVRGDYYADLRTGTAPWLNSPQAQRSFGANVPRFAYRFHTAPLVPAQDYDGLAFVARSTCSHPLPGTGV
ncbi:erythromycin esterase [Streptomyces abyssalis]|uniref:Erythromycin esterase n=1 Tax=Streptomyces abyssalis TaxID=933944 RepID=A0A1E7JQK0_9ACTN|nr:erythromycin esterase family protein [Streptomyces abyssalis]OEU90540.1 erythromycin esterase [Streptomyces abyssalis]OEU95279.1 erythromycin esterase [Streptomyces abyssalis]